MTVLILQRVPASLRGFLTRWMLELEPGVFVGRLSAQVRDAVWREVEAALRGTSGATLVCAASSAQGLSFRESGHPDREIVDHEGVYLIRRKTRRL